MKRKIKFIYFILISLISSVLFGCKGKEPTPVELLLSNPPTSTTYKPGDTFNPAGVELIYVMSDGSMKYCNNYEYSPSGALSLTDNKITFTSEELNVDVAINVQEGGDNAVEKHLIKNKDGSYGGTYNLHKYGEGTPLNGEYDHVDSEYYSIVDYYNMKATPSRKFYSHYEPYQQTMAYTDGIANVLALLNYLKQDMSNIDEYSLVKQYEQLNSKIIYGNGTDAAGLKKLLASYGVNSEINTFEADTSKAINVEIRLFSEYLQNEVFDKGYIMMVRLTDVNGFAWHTIIGLDDMGTDNWGRDDQAILMDSYDVTDHYQDGYNLMSLGRLYRWWEDVKIGRRTGHVNQFECVLVKPDTPLQMTEGPVKTMPSQAVPNKHLILNADGSYGGNTDKDLYGTGASKNGQFDNVIEDYYKLVDYHNMECTDSRLIMKNFMPFQQTMASSCTLCSLMVTINYYGEEINDGNNEIGLVNRYERLNNTIINGVGCNCNGRMRVLEELGYDARKNTVSDNHLTNFFKDYNEFKEWAWNLFSMDMPIPISWTPIGDHGEVLVGIETMGTDYIYDDVIVLADSADNWDLYQDGYNTVPATLFYAQWFEGLDGDLTSQSFNYFFRRSAE